MPELPEVETVRRDLVQALSGVKITDVTVIHPKTIQPLLAKDFSAQLKGQIIKTIERIGKLLIFIFTKKSEVLLVHLKMTGQLIWQSQGERVAGGHSLSEPVKELPNKHTRLVVTFGKHGQLFFNDLRLFGYWKMVTPTQLVEIKSQYGIEPLTANFTWPLFDQALGTRTTNIKALLLNQAVISGMGNIYVDEALWRAKIKPTRRVRDITPAERRVLFAACQKVIELGVKHRGTTFNHFVDGNGAKGNFLQFLEVYGRAKLPCSRCQTPIKKIKLAGRGTHYCPQCQS